MAVVREAPGRGREYASLEAGLKEFDNADIAYAGALLVEASNRAIDLFRGVQPDALQFQPTPETPSIARFVIHMAWAEAGWLTRLSGMPIPEDIAADLKPGNLSILQGKDDTSLPPEISDTYLKTLVLTVRERITIPGLKTIEDIDSVVLEGTGPRTPRQVLSHLVWHWTYHSGQVGLLRLQTGSDYTWCNA